MEADRLLVMTAAFRFDPVELPAECEALRSEVREFIAASGCDEPGEGGPWFLPSPPRGRRGSE